MGGCVSTPNGGAGVTDAEKRAHREAERQIAETKKAMAAQVKVLLLGSGDSGKSTILKQMRVIHAVAFNANEVEFYRQLVFQNLTYGLKCILDAADELQLVTSPENADAVKLVEEAPDLKDGDAFPPEYEQALARLWKDQGIAQTVARGNEFALPENMQYFIGQLPRLFSPGYVPTSDDIVNTRARTVGITETAFNLKEHELLMVDVGGQKSERRKWIHCFQDVTTILFLVSLSGYDQCLVEDKDANQMQDAMTIWDSICHSQWFKHTSIILFMNKEDLFAQKVKGGHSPIKNFFPDFDGASTDVSAGKEYFKKRFVRLAQKAGRSKEREVYIHFTTATNTQNLRIIMGAVEE